MRKLSKLIVSIVTVIALVLINVVVSTPVQAAAADYQKAQISFTFDDGFVSMYQNAVPILTAAGFKGTLYYITGIGDKTYQNGTTDDGKVGMTWAQVQALQNTYGWEIGSHTVSHPLMSTLTKAQVDTELINSKAALVAHGITPVNFAFPQGDYSNTTLVETAKYYQTSRGFQDVGLETYPFNNIVVLDESLESKMTLAQAEAFVDQAITNKQWLVFTGHGVQAAADPKYAYIWTTANFQALVTYVKSKSVPVVKLGDAVKPIGTNLTTNASFEQGLDTGWTNDSTTAVTLDTGTNGSYPSPTNSVKMAGSATASHLFSTLINAVPGKDYLVNAFVNTIGLTAGEFGFYLDEYDTNGNWISGQWLGLIANNTVGFFNKVVQATSTLVSQFRVQTYLTAGSTGSVITDNVNLYDLTATASATPTPTTTPSVMPTPTATPSGTPTPTPVANNLVPNGSFETVANGFAVSWTHDTPSVTIDTTSKGNEASNSATVAGSTTSNHLFSSPIVINPALAYTWNTYVKTNSLVGEFGFYIDEYDNLGNWVSGKWLGMVNAAFDGIKTIAYSPTSALVNSIGLQYYITPNSTGSVTVDSVSLTGPVTTTPTPTITPTVTPTVTPTATPSGTITPTPTESVTPTPTVTVTPTATPSVTPTVTPTPGVNLIANPSFETVDATGFATSWTRDNTEFAVDSTSLGDNGANSILLTNNGTATHMFSVLTNVDSTLQYIWSSYIKTANLTGEFGFYIDEYDATGTWISGQWKGMINTAFTGVKQFNYIPTSATVKAIRLQYYVSTGATGTVTIDSNSLTSK